MKAHYLTPLLSPASVALIGASDRTGSVGEAVLTNLLTSDYQGELYLVNPNHRVVAGCTTVANVRHIDAPVDLAVVTTALRTLPGIIKDCGRQGAKAVLLAKAFNDSDALEAEVMRESVAIARQFSMRILGPNMSGLMRPVIGLNASTHIGHVSPGHLALVSHSSALCAAMLDWADSHGIGFTSVISMGETFDLDFGEVLDFLASDQQTEGILLHLHDIQDARRFMSALRVAARFKPVVVIKSGREDVPSTGVTHASHLVGTEAVFEMALARAGVLRVDSIAQLFTAAKVLAANYRTQGNRLAIVTNGAGPGQLAADSARDLGVALASFAEPTRKLLAAALPPTASVDNPVNIVGDASPARFRTTVKACLDDPNSDGVLVIFTPQRGAEQLSTAELMLGLQKTSHKPLFLSWLGDAKVAESRALFSAHKAVHFHAPEMAVEVFRSLAAYHHNQHLLSQTPGPLQERVVAPDLVYARRLIAQAQADGHTLLSECESKAVLAAFTIPVNEVRLARSAKEAVAHAEAVGYPVVLKIDSPDIYYKSDVGGVELNLRSAGAVRAMYDAILLRARAARPGSVINGITVQPMIRPRYRRELMVGVAHDTVFGPIICFGAGGVAVEVMRDTRLSLPPLNDELANNLIQETQVAKILGAFRNMLPVNLDAIKSVLLRVSEMVCELPDIVEMDINPLLADERGVVALDARIVIRPHPSTVKRYSHMAIMPYPTNLVQQLTLYNGTPVTIRPVRPEDAEAQQRFVRDLSEESRYNRYMAKITELSQPQLARFTLLDYDREMALVMVRDEAGCEVQLAIARYFTNVDNESCEFALVVADAWQGQGVGTLLMDALRAAARGQGLRSMHGEVLATNHGMLKLMQRLGFSCTQHPEDKGLVWVSAMLSAP